MRIKIYLINPESDATNNYIGLSDGETKFTRVGALSITTVAAMVPPDIEVVLCDEVIEPINYEIDADIIGISANVSQGLRAIEISAEFRSRGKLTIIGGPHVSLAPDLFSGKFDSLAIGEFESIAEAFFADVRKRSLLPRYFGNKVDMAISPKPRWDLYRNEKALTGVVQTSRGCPFSCEFCDVIQYLGRVQRHKANIQVIEELQQLYELGYRYISLADDNFTVYRKRTKSLLTAINQWNGGSGRERVSLITQASIDIARDDDILALCAESGLKTLFIGLETINQDSLVECNKRQNVALKMSDQVEKIVSHGISIEAGLVVGFDHDQTDIFERQFNFAENLPIAGFLVSVLVAPVSTPLYKRMHEAGRIVSDSVLAQFPSSTQISNIQPAQMTREELQIGAKWLSSRLMHPFFVGKRIKKIAEIAKASLGARSATGSRATKGHFANLGGNLLRRLAHEDNEAAVMIKECLALVRREPSIKEMVSLSLSDYAIRRFNLQKSGIYDGKFAEMNCPPI